MSAVVMTSDVEACYDERRALDGITLRMEQGETMGLVGRSGAGKSTFLLVLVGLVRCTAGTARVCGFDVAGRRDLPRIRRLAGLVFQNSDDQLFSATVYDDVAFGPLNLGWSDDLVRERVEAALEMVGAARFGDRISHHLSAGEKRRVALATVLAMEPELLLLDEPSSGLDPSARRRIIEVLRALPQAKLIASHDLEFVLETCPRVVVLDAGRVVAQGAARTLLADQDLMRRTGLEVPHSLRSLNPCLD